MITFGEQSGVEGMGGRLHERRVRGPSALPARNPSPQADPGRQEKEVCAGGVCETSERSRPDMRFRGRTSAWLGTVGGRRRIGADSPATARWCCKQRSEVVREYRYAQRSRVRRVDADDAPRRARNLP